MKAAHWLEGGRLLPGVIVVSLGGNIGTEAQLRDRMHAAVRTLSNEWGPAEFSELYRSAPVGLVAEQADFINAVAAWRPEPAVAPEAVLVALQSLELAAGRVRDMSGGPRTLDLDLLLVGQEQREGAALVLPHPRMHERAFVLAPMQELFGGEMRWQERSLGQLVGALGGQRIKRIGE